MQKKLKNYILKSAAGKFLSCDDELEGYKKLLKQEKSGNGDDMAASFVDVWEPFENSSVSEIVELIDDEVLALNAFVTEFAELQATA